MQLSLTCQMPVNFCNDQLFQNMKRTRHYLFKQVATDQGGIYREGSTINFTSKISFFIS